MPKWNKSFKNVKPFLFNWLFQGLNSILFFFFFFSTWKEKGKWRLGDAPDIVTGNEAWQDTAQTSWPQLSQQSILVQRIRCKMLYFSGERLKAWAPKALLYFTPCLCMWWETMLKIPMVTIPMLTSVLYHVQTKVPPESPSLDSKIAGNCAKLQVTDKTLSSGSQRKVPKMLVESMWNISTLPPDLKFCISSQKSPQNLGLLHEWRQTARWNVPY